jgi:predicted transglutaminase-like cysteine proteinase
MIPTQRVKKAFVNNKNFIKKAIMYMIDSKTRTKINLAQFLKTQLIVYEKDLDKIVEEQRFLKIKSKDLRAIRILKYVHSILKYKSDISVYNSSEHWASIGEILKKEVGDCEDGAILIFCLMRRAGFTENDVQLIAGKVSGGNHAWISYLSEKYPMSYYFLDWCYWYDSTLIRQNRNWYSLVKTVITDKYNRNDKYKTYWFLVTDKDGWI